LLRRTALLAVGAALALPSVAAAGTVQFTPPVPCLQAGKSYAITGTGFSPFRTVSFSGDGVTTSYEAGEDGSFSTDAGGGLGVSEYDSFTPKTVNVTVTDLNPALSTSISFEVVKFGSNLPVKGKPSKVVTWEFAGFLNSAPIYAHYLYERKEKKTVRFGTGQGPCGTLSKRAVRFPIKKPKNFGTWEVRIDSNPKWSRNSESLAETSFHVAKPRRRG
jgi:hypothetical protein